MGRFQRGLVAPPSRPYRSCFRCWNHGLVVQFNRYHICKYSSCCCDLCVEAVWKSRALVASRRGAYSTAGPRRQGRDEPAWRGSPPELHQDICIGCGEVRCVCRTAGPRRQGRDEPAWRGSPPELHQDICIGCGEVRCVCRTAGPRRQDWDGPAWTGSPPDDGGYRSATPDVLNECSGCGEVRRAFSLCYRCWNHGLEEEFSRYHVCKHLLCRCDLCILAAKDYHASRKTGCMCKTSKTIRQNHNDSPRCRPIKRSRNIISTTYFCECGRKVGDCLCNSGKKAKLSSVGAVLSEEAGRISEEKSAKKVSDTSSQSTTASSSSTQHARSTEETDGKSRKQSENKEMESLEEHVGNSQQLSEEMPHHAGKSTSSSAPPTNLSNPKKLPDATATKPIMKDDEISRPSVCGGCSELRWQCICTRARGVQPKADRPVQSAQPAQSLKRSRNYILTTYYCKCGNNVQSCECPNAKQAKLSPAKANRSERVGGTRAASLRDDTGTKSKINVMAHATKPGEVKSLHAEKIEASKENTTELSGVEEQTAKSSDDEGTDMSGKKATELVLEDKTVKPSDTNQIKTSNVMSLDTSRVERCALNPPDAKEMDSPGVQELIEKLSDIEEIEDHDTKSPKFLGTEEIIAKPLDIKAIDIKSSESSGAEELTEDPSDVKEIEASQLKCSEPPGVVERTAISSALMKIETNDSKSSMSLGVEDVKTMEVSEKKSSNSLEVVEWAGKPSGIKKIEDHDMTSSESPGMEEIRTKPLGIKAIDMNSLELREMEEVIAKPFDIKAIDMKSSESSVVEEWTQEPSDNKEIEASQSKCSEPPGVVERTAISSALMKIETYDSKSSMSLGVEDVKTKKVSDKKRSNSLELFEWAGKPSDINKVEDHDMTSSESPGMEEIRTKPLGIKAIYMNSSESQEMEEVIAKPFDIKAIDMNSSESSVVEEWTEDPSDNKEIDASHTNSSEPSGAEERTAIPPSALKKIETNDTKSSVSSRVEVCGKKSFKSLEVVEWTAKPLNKEIGVFQKKSTEFFEVEECLANPSDVKDIEASDAKGTEPLAVDKQTEKTLDVEKDIGAVDKTRTEAVKVSEDAAMNWVMEGPTSALCEEFALEVTDEPSSPISTSGEKLNESGTSQLAEEVRSGIHCALPLTIKSAPAQRVKTQKHIKNRCVLLIPERKHCPIELSEEKRGRDIVVQPTLLAEDVINHRENALPKGVKSINQGALPRTVTSSLRESALTLSVNAGNCLEDKSALLLISEKNTDPSLKETRDNNCALLSQLVEQVVKEESVQPVTISPKVSLEREICVLEQSAHLNLERKKLQDKPCQVNPSLPQCEENPILKSILDRNASNVDNSARESTSSACQAINGFLSDSRGDPGPTVGQTLQSKHGDSNKVTSLKSRNVPMNEGKDPSQQELTKSEVSCREDAIRNAYNFSFLRCKQCKAMRFSKAMLNLHSSLAHENNQGGMRQCRVCPNVSNQDMFFVADHEDVFHMGLLPLDRVVTLVGLMKDALYLSSL